MAILINTNQNDTLWIFPREIGAGYLTGKLKNNT